MLFQLIVQLLVLNFLIITSASEDFAGRSLPSSNRDGQLNIKRYGGASFNSYKSAPYHQPAPSYNYARPHKYKGKGSYTGLKYGAHQQHAIPDYVIGYLPPYVVPPVKNPYLKPYGSSYFPPYQTTSYSNSFGSSYDIPHTSSYGNQHGSPYKSSYDTSYGASYGKSYSPSYSSHSGSHALSYSSDYSNGYGNSYSSGYGSGYGSGYDSSHGNSYGNSYGSSDGSYFRSSYENNHNYGYPHSPIVTTYGGFNHYQGPFSNSGWIPTFGPYQTPPTSPSYGLISKSF